MSNLKIFLLQRRQRTNHNERFNLQCVNWNQKHIESKKNSYVFFKYWQNMASTSRWKCQGIVKEKDCPWKKQPLAATIQKWNQNIVMNTAYGLPPDTGNDFTEYWQFVKETQTLTNRQKRIRFDKLCRTTYRTNSSQKSKDNLIFILHLLNTRSVLLSTRFNLAIYWLW